MSVWRHLLWSIRYGDWSIGFASQKQWPKKKVPDLPVAQEVEDEQE